MTFKVLGRGLLGLAAVLCCLLPAAPVSAQNPLRNENGVPYTALLGCDGLTPISESNPLCTDAEGGGGGGGGFDPFTPTGNATRTVSTSSANVALGSADDTTIVYNSGSVDAYVAFGNSGVTATTSSTRVPAGAAYVFDAGTSTHLAAISASGSGSLSITTGIGQPLIALAGAGGAGGGAVTIGDGADVAQGDVDDAAWSGSGAGTSIAIAKAIHGLTGALGSTACATDDGSCSLNALLKRNNQRLTSILTGPLPSSVSDGANIALGDKDNLAATSSVGSYDVIQLLKGLLAAAQDTTAVAVSDGGSSLTVDFTMPPLVAGSATIGNVVVNSLPATPAGTNHVGRFAPEPTATSGCTLTGTQSAASTNATNLKASAGVLCGGHVINTTATLYYLRLYNLSSAPTCSSSTGFVATIPVPASGSGAGTLVDLGPFGAAFPTGIGFCITGGGGSTDNTNAATGVYANLTWR